MYIVMRIGSLLPGGDSSAVSDRVRPTATHSCHLRVSGMGHQLQYLSASQRPAPWVRGGKVKDLSREPMMSSSVTQRYITTF